MLLAIAQGDGKWAMTVMNRCIQVGVNTDKVMTNVADLMSAGDHEIPEQPDWYDLD